MIVNGAITGGAVLLGALVLWGVWWWLGHDEGRHTADALTREDVAVNPYGTLGCVPDPAAAAASPGIPQPPPPALHHDEYAPAQRWHPDVPGQPDRPARAQMYSGPPGTLAGDPAAAPTAGPPPVTPLAAVTAAADAIRGMPASEYLQQLQDATTWENRAPFTDWLSGDTLARGIPAIRDGGDWDAPLSIPAEVVHEMEAGV